MEIGSVTTPFGRRTMSLGLLASQALARNIAPETCVDKWKLYRSLCEARSKLGVSDRALSVLNALMSFHPKTELSGEDALVVFPSNAQLSLRTHGMAEATLRRHLAALVEAGLLMRRDSPNGKRYARKNGQGAIREAFGFCLSPLLARSEEITRLAAEVVSERHRLQRLRERVTLVRRDIVKLIAAARDEGLPGDWTAYEDAYRSLMDALPRIPLYGALTAALTGLEALRENILNCLQQHMISLNTDGNAGQIERHIQNSNTESLKESEQQTDQTAVTEPSPQSVTQSGIDEGELAPTEIPRNPESSRRLVKSEENRGVPRSYPLALVLQACPEIVAFGPGGAIRDWRDLDAAASVVRTMLGVKPDAYHQASSILGAENAATVIACILERAEHIQSPGGYLRDLTRRASRNQFSPGPMLQALARARSVRERTVQ